MAKQSLAAQTGALAEMKMPAIFQQPQAQVIARNWPPYITFAHPKRADEWKRIASKHNTPNEGDMFLIESAGVTRLSPAKVTLLACKQSWAKVNAAGETLEASWEEMPHPFKEHVDAVLLLYLEDRITPVNIQFRSVKCPAAKVLSDELAAASLPDWSEKSPAHKESLVCQEPWMRFYGLMEFGPQRTSKTTGLPYRPLRCDTFPTAVPEWRLLKAFTTDPGTPKALEAAASLYQSRINDLAKKVR